jgi:Mg2+/citrate symporter
LSLIKLSVSDKIEKRKKEREKERKREREKERKREREKERKREREKETFYHFSIFAFIYFIVLLIQNTIPPVLLS